MMTDSNSATAVTLATVHPQRRSLGQRVPSAQGRIGQGHSRLGAASTHPTADSEYLEIRAPSNKSSMMCSLKEDILQSRAAESEF